MPKKAQFKGREAPKKESSQDGSVLGAIHNSRPIFTFVLDFVINRGLAPQLQKALDDEEMNFNIGDYIDDKRS